MQAAGIEGCRWCIDNGLAGEVLARNGSHFVVSKPHPTNPAAIIAPLRHVETPFDLTAEEWAGFGEMLAAAKEHLAPFNPDGFTIGWNIGEAGGQHILHAHLHVISRFGQDAAAGRGLRDFIFR